MKRYTQEDFDNFEQDENGRIQCPSGDYTEIKAFPNDCDFAQLCLFGQCCIFGARCVFGQSCSFGQWCNFGERCRFDEQCRFGEQCSFGSDCRCEFGEFHKLLTFGGFGSDGRTTYVFALTDGTICVRCGCFAGMLEEWEAKVKETHGESNYGRSYLTLARAVGEMLGKE